MGGVLVDNIVEADGTLHLDQVGGNALHAAAGARLFLDRVGVVGRVPENYPMAALDGLDFDLGGIARVPGTRALAEWFFHRADGSRTDHLHADASELAEFGFRQDRLSPTQSAQWLAHLQATAAERTGFAQFRARHPVTPGDVPSGYWNAKGAHLGANQPTAMLACARAARAAGLVVTLDPGFRAAEMDAAFLDALLPQLDAFLPSEKELAVLAPGLGTGPALAALAKRMSGIVAVKCGSVGAYLHVDGGAPVLLPAIPVQARDPVGAGDAFCGGVLSGLCDGLAPVDAVRRGIVAGSFAVEAPGVRHFASVTATDRARRSDQAAQRSTSR